MLTMSELDQLLRFTRFYQTEQSFPADGEHWAEVDRLAKKLEYLMWEKSDEPMDFFNH